MGLGLGFNLLFVLSLIKVAYKGRLLWTKFFQACGTQTVEGNVFALHML